MEESIYNILPKYSIPTKHSILYKYPFPAIIPPSYSSFDNHSNVIDIKNISGSYYVQKGRYDIENGIIGKTKTQQLSPIKHKIMGTNKLEDWIQKGSLLLDINHSHRQKVKPQVPKSAERPLMYEHKQQNYIETNKIYTILTTPRQPQKQTDWLKKGTYGKVPPYLSKIKQRIYQSFMQQQEDYANQNTHLQLESLLKKTIIRIRIAINQIRTQIEIRFDKFRILETLSLKEI
ncbi:unnamed protein product [Paramecium octaurelia]|uniref:Enkurin domain-containing protein n=1 Tax=Paramecium octaurelia TaxID=43137 RepID=A0A8S1UMN2_PAROT|nr:unnamed protein product [Paramecium octaurelia]